ncbi:hypothetical protein BJP34_27185 [Moorena producens PAL-8-15-08-1]|uniref:Uncharacterized protein n=1 Tax=Moorena producens PAL-8-15-08-1 TaxID=1458985 RepID=A0A1D8TYX0_9CYAN|nr:hypothetical protein [Moorena producens]AOX02636.1 hypothetical protein BJP34_27185 [Moorena producens PAL-8-15-08-1]
MPNLDISNKADNTITAKAYIEQILNQLLIDYQATHGERVEISRWEENKDVTILGIIELLTDTIRGYAFQVINDNFLENAPEITNELQKLKLLEIPELSEWYFSQYFDYPKMKHYVETLNYLRLLIIEYISDIKGLVGCVNEV